MVTELGTTHASGDGFVNQSETNLWFSLMNENRLYNCNWSVAEKIETSASLVSGAPEQKGGC